MSESHPELDGYEPNDGRPLRGRRLQTMMRVVVSVGIIALILPGILITAGTANATATRTCGIYAAASASSAVGSDARFELFGPAGPSWYCYRQEFGGREQLLRGLGIIPGTPVLPSAPIDER